MPLRKHWVGGARFGACPRCDGPAVTLPAAANPGALMPCRCGPAALQDLLGVKTWPADVARLARGLPSLELRFDSEALSFKGPGWVDGVSGQLEPEEGCSEESDTDAAIA